MLVKMRFGAGGRVTVVMLPACTLSVSLCVHVHALNARLCVQPCSVRGPLCAPAPSGTGSVCDYRLVGFAKMTLRSLSAQMSSRCGG